MAANRTVKVSLEVRAAEARKQIRGTGDDARKLDQSARAAGRGLDKMSEEAAQAGRATEKAAAKTKMAKVEAEAYKRELGSLDRQIDATVLHLKVLGREFSATGDKSVLAKLRAERSMLSQLRQIQKDLTPATNAFAAVSKQSAGGISDALGALPMQARGALILGLSAIAVASSPIIGSIIAGAVLGGIGSGGIIGGIALAAQDPAVAGAAKGVGQRFADGLKNEASSAFAGPLLAAFGPLERAGNELTDELGKGFRELAPLVVPLANGVEGLVHNLGPGLSKAFKAAEPAVRLIARELPGIGDAISDALSAIADHSDGAIMGLKTLFNIVDVGIRATGMLIGFLSEAFEMLVRVEGAVLGFAAQLPVVGVLGTAFSAGAAGADKLEQSLNDAKSSGDSFVGTLSDLIHGLDGAKTSTDELRDALVEYANELATQFDPTAKLIHSLEEVKDRQKEYAQAVREHGRNSDEARAANLRLAESILAANSASAIAAGTFDGKLPTALRETLKAGGMTAKQLDDIEKQAREAHHELDGLSGTYRAKVILDIQETHREDARLYRRWGGIAEHAATGLLRDPAIYSTANPARYAFAEPATGGEAFVPKRGDYGRSMSILSQAAGWYGADVVPLGGRGGMSAAGISPDLLARSIRSALMGLTVTMDGRAVGRLTGRDADLLRRSN